MADTGSHTITLTVTNSGAGGQFTPLSASETIQINVAATDTAPLLLPVANPTINENQPFQLQLQTQSANPDFLIYQTSALPQSAKFNPRTGLFSWTPAFGQAGTYAVAFTVTDGTLSSSQDVTLTVAHVNRPPTIAPVTPQFGQEGQPLAFAVAGADPNGLALTYFVQGTLPAGATFNTTNGIFQWTPAFGQAGAYTITLGVTDTAGLSALVTVPLPIQHVDRPPTFAPLRNHQAIVGQPFQLTIAGQRPKWPRADVRCHWHPGRRRSGPSHRRTDVDADRARSRSTESLHHRVRWLANASAGLEIIAAAQAVPPAVLIQTTPSFASIPGEPVQVQVIASSIAAIGAISLQVDGKPVTLDAQGRATLLPPVPGHYTLTATATDADGFMGSTTLDLKVRDPNNHTAPVVALDVPPAGAILTDVTAVIGSVSSSNLNQFTLTIAPLAGGSAVVLAQSESTVADATLATLDPGLLANGAYLLTLDATDIAGRAHARDAPGGNR